MISPDNLAYGDSYLLLITNYHRVILLDLKAKQCALGWAENLFLFGFLTKQAVCQVEGVCSSCSLRC